MKKTVVMQLLLFVSAVLFGGIFFGKFFTKEHNSTTSREIFFLNASEEASSFFYEARSNDGTFPGVLSLRAPGKVRLPKSIEGFYSINNLPSGLTANITQVDSKLLQLTLHGKVDVQETSIIPVTFMYLGDPRYNKSDSFEKKFYLRMGSWGVLNRLKNSTDGGVPWQPTSIFSKDGNIYVTFENSSEVQIYSVDYLGKYTYKKLFNFDEPGNYYLTGDKKNTLVLNFQRGIELRDEEFQVIDNIENSYKDVTYNREKDTYYLLMGGSGVIYSYNKKEQLPSEMKEIAKVTGSQMIFFRGDFLVSDGATLRVYSGEKSQLREIINFSSTIQELSLNESMGNVFVGLEGKLVSLEYDDELSRYQVTEEIQTGIRDVFAITMDETNSNLYVLDGEKKEIVIFHYLYRN